MKPRSLYVTLALVAGATFLPLAAQTPLFNDGTVFGGSKVFSEGLNPLGNPSRYDRPASGWYLTYQDGDQRAKDNASLLQDTTSSDAAVTSQALKGLQDAPWALRTRAFGITGIKDAMNYGYTHEEFRSLFMHGDLAPLDLGSMTALSNNASFVDGRRAKVDRIHFGGGALAAGTSAGFGVRLESWRLGTFTPYFNQPRGTYTYSPLGLFPFASVDDEVMGYNHTDWKASNWALDLGFTAELAQGVRLGATVDQLNAKRLWDVDMKPQIRAALQLDLGDRTTLTLEGDLNKAARMPFPERQSTYAASLRYQLSQAVSVLLGGENRKIGDANVTRGGATLQLRAATFLVSFGFQAGQDRPMKGLTLMVD